MRSHARELAVLGTNLLLLVLLAITTSGFFTAANFSDLFLANVPVLIVALGMTLIILTGQIDISVGSVFAACSIVTGMAAKAGLPPAAFVLIACLAGALLGAFNGALSAWCRIPSIVATLATMVAIRDGIRWYSQGAWISDLPAGFLRFGMQQSTYTVLVFVTAAVLVAGFAYALRFLRPARTFYAIGSNEAAARIIGINTDLVVFSAFTITGALIGLAAALNSVRFNQIPSNSGIGLEMQVIAAVVVGGTAITGGSGTILGTLFGVALLGTISPALTFLGVSAYWGKAIQGAIILAAVSINVIGSWRKRRVTVAA